MAMIAMTTSNSIEREPMTVPTRVTTHGGSPDKERRVLTALLAIS